MFKRLVSLILIVFMLFPTIVSIADENDAEHTPSGSSRAGETVTWTSGEGGGTTGYSDTITYDDVEDSDVGTYSTLNAAYKSKDAWEDKIGDWLESNGKMKLSKLFWDGVHGRYINIEELEYTPEQLLYLINIVMQYNSYLNQAEETLHIVDDVVEEIEQKKEDFRDNFTRINANLFDPSKYNPADGISFDNLCVKKPTLNAFDDDFFKKVEEWYKEANGELKLGPAWMLTVIPYEDYMLNEFGIDVNNGDGKKYELTWVIYKNPSLFVQYSSATDIYDSEYEENGWGPATYPKKVYPGMFKYPQSPSRFPSQNSNRQEATYKPLLDNNIENDAIYDTPSYLMLGTKESILFAAYGSATFFTDSDGKPKTINATKNYHMLNAPKNLKALGIKEEELPMTIVYMGPSSLHRIPEESEYFLEEQNIYIFSTKEKSRAIDAIMHINKTIKGNRIQAVLDAIRQWGIVKTVERFFYGLSTPISDLPDGAITVSTPIFQDYGDIIDNFAAKGYNCPGFIYDGFNRILYFVPKDDDNSYRGISDKIKAYNDENGGRENLDNKIKAEFKTNIDLFKEFCENGGTQVPDVIGDVNSGYTNAQFKNVKQDLSKKAQQGLSAIIAKQQADERLAGNNYEDILNGLVDQNLADAQANADSNQYEFDAANGQVIADMSASIGENTEFLTEHSWPHDSVSPENYDYVKAIMILKSTFNLKDDEIDSFLASLKKTIEECQEESIPIEGVGPNGYIIDYETKEARYMALLSYVFLMCARDTIDIQHVVVCEGNSYINNVIMSQSPMQFPAEVVGGNGVANYCWAIQCVDSEYEGDIGRYVAKATNGNQLSYKFTSPGTYRIVATRNMLSTVETAVAMTYHEYWYIEETGQVIYSRIVKGHVNTVGPEQFNPAGRKDDEVCLYFNRHGEQSCYSEGDSETGIPGTVVFETYWTVTDGDGNYIPPAGAFGSDSQTRQTG